MHFLRVVLLFLVVKMKLVGLLIEAVLSQKINMAHQNIGARSKYVGDSSVSVFR